MSGEKRSPIQIVRDDLNRTRNQMKNIRKANNKLASSMIIANEKRIEQQQYFQQQLRNRDKKYEQTVSSMNSSLKHMEHKHLSAIRRQNDNFNQQIVKERNERRKSITDLHNYTVKSINATKKEFQEITNNQQREINSVKNDIKDIFQKEINNKNATINFINDFQKQLQTFNEQEPHNKFTPGEFLTINNKLKDAKSKVGNMEQAAMANSQTIYYEFIELRKKVRLKELEFNHWRDLGIESSTALFEDIRKNHKYELENNAGEIEINEWTDGDFFKLEEEVNQIRKELIENKENLSLERVKYLLEEIKKQTIKEQDLINEAIERVLSSDKRREMAIIIAKTLSEFGFKPTNAGYEKSDFKNLYIAKLKRYNDGVEIIVTLIPDDETNTNILSLNTKQPGFFNEKHSRERFYKIADALRDKGLNVGEMEGKSEHIEEFYDIENIIDKNGTGISKELLEKKGLIKKETKQNN